MLDDYYGCIAVEIVGTSYTLAEAAAVACEMATDAANAAKSASDSADLDAKAADDAANAAARISAKYKPKIADLQLVISRIPAEMDVEKAHDLLEKTDGSFAGEP